MEISPSTVLDTMSPQKHSDVVRGHGEEVQRQRVLPWSREVSEILTRITSERPFEDPLAASRVKREAAAVLPLPNGAQLTTKVAQIEGVANSEISHELKFPMEKVSNVHGRVLEPEIIISSHRNHLSENPQALNPRVAQILNDKNQTASEKVATMMRESLVDFDEIEKIRQHVLGKHSENNIKPDIEEKIRKTQEFLDFKSILDSTKLNDTQKFSQIQERAMFPDLVKSSVEKANKEYPNEAERSHPYYMSIIDDLQEKYAQKTQEYEKLQVAKLEQKNQKLTDSIIDMLKLSKLQRTLKLSTYTPEEKLNIVKAEKLVPEQILAELDKGLKSKSPEELVKSLVKSAEYGTRQITSSLAGINSAASFEKAATDAFPVMTSKVLYLGDPKAKDTLSVTFKWNYPNLDEDTKKLTQKALELMKVDHSQPEQSFDHVMKLLITEIKPPASFNSAKLMERETLNKNTEKAFQSNDLNGFKLAMTQLFESYKTEAKNPKEFQQLFKIAETHLTSMMINSENDRKNVISRPEISASSPEKMMSEQFKAHAAERDKLFGKLKNLDSLEASEIALSTTNIIKDIYAALPEELKKSSKAEYDNLQLSLAKLKMTINNEPDILVKRDLKQEVIDAQKNVNNAMEKFGEKILPSDPVQREEFLANLTKIQEKEWKTSVDRQKEILQSSGLPEYQTNKEVLDKHTGMASLMSMIQSNTPQGTSLEISIKEGEREISKTSFLPDAPQAAPSRMLRIGEFNIPIPGAPGSADFSHTDKQGNKVSISNGFVVISDKENHTKRLITPQGTDIEFHPKGTPHKAQLEEKQMASTRVSDSRYIMAEPGNAKLKANLAALQRRTGASAGLSKATANNSTPVSSIQTRYGEVYGMEPNGYYTFEIKNNGKFIAYDADPARNKSHNFNAPKTTVFEA